MRHEGIEVVQGGVGPARGLGDDHLVRHGRRCRRQAPVPVVLALDPDDGEVGRQPLDLAPEVVRGEAPLTQRVRQRVRRGGEPDAAVDELAQQARHEHGVAGVVELELVHADQAEPGQPLDGPAEAQRADEMGVLDERPEGRRPRGGVPQRGEQVRLADAETAVQVDTSGLPSRGPAAERPPPGGAARACRAVGGDVRGEGLQPLDGLAWLGCAGSGVNVAKRSRANRGGGVSSASSRSGGTRGLRSTSCAGAAPGAAGRSGASTRAA